MFRNSVSILIIYWEYFDCFSEQPACLNSALWKWCRILQLSTTNHVSRYKNKNKTFEFQNDTDM